MLETLVTWNKFTFAVCRIRDSKTLLSLKPRANGRKIVGQQLPTLLKVVAVLAQLCWMLHQCCVRLHTLLHVVVKFETGQTFSYVQTNATTPNTVRQKC